MDRFEQARITWIKRQREIYRAQLQRLTTGTGNPFDGAGDSLIFAKTTEAEQVLRDWIAEIDTMLGLDHA